MDKPKVVIDNEVFRKIMYWVRKSNYEVSGLGTLVVEDDGVLRVKSAVLLPQKNGSTHTDIEPEDVGKLMFQLKDEPGELRFWWHSHVNMAVFWSGTDMDTIKKLGHGGWFLSTVFNKKAEIKSAFYAVEGINTPWGSQSLFMDDLTTDIEPFIEPLHAEWDEEYQTNVTNVTHAMAPWPEKEWDSALGEWVDHLPNTNNLAPASSLLDLGQRPVGMSKKAWKRIKKQILPPTEVCDAYGFTQAEREYLYGQGWHTHDLDEMLDYKLNPVQILQLAENDLSASEVYLLMDEGNSLEQILFDTNIHNDEMPVMDRSKGGAYDA